MQEEIDTYNIPLTEPLRVLYQYAEKELLIKEIHDSLKKEIHEVKPKLLSFINERKKQGLLSNNQYKKLTDQLEGL